MDFCSLSVTDCFVRTHKHTEITYGIVMRRDNKNLWDEKNPAQVEVKTPKSKKVSTLHYICLFKRNAVLRTEVMSK